MIVVLRRAALLTPEKRMARWRRLAVGNTIAGVVVSVLALVFLPLPIGLIVTGAMAIGVGDTWYLDRRIHRSGSFGRSRRQP
jgi:hypothetical protein